MGQIIAAPFSCSFFVFSDGQLDKETSDSLLPIIASQRERFRTRNLELETVCTFLYNKRTRFQGEKPGFRKNLTTTVPCIVWIRTRDIAAIKSFTLSIVRISNTIHSGTSCYLLSNLLHCQS